MILVVKWSATDKVRSDVPVRIIIFRVYTNSKKYINEIAEISKELMSKHEPSISTNI